MSILGLSDVDISLLERKNFAVNFRAGESEEIEKCIEEIKKTVEENGRTGKSYRLSNKSPELSKYVNLCVHINTLDTLESRRKLNFLESIDSIEDSDIYKKLLLLRPDILEVRGKFGSTWLHRVADKGNIDAMQSILEIVPAEYLNIVDLSQWTPLFYAVSDLNDEAINLLLDHGNENLCGVLDLNNMTALSVGLVNCDFGMKLPTSTILALLGRKLGWTDILVPIEYKLDEEETEDYRKHLILLLVSLFEDIIVRTLFSLDYVSVGSGVSSQFWSNDSVVKNASVWLNKSF